MAAQQDYEEEFASGNVEPISTPASTRASSGPGTSDEDVGEHFHDDNPISKVSFGLLTGLITTVSAVPTYTPRWVSEQIVIYKSGGTIRLYVWDSVNIAWHYSTLT